MEQSSNLGDSSHTAPVISGSPPRDAVTSSPLQRGRSDAGQQHRHAQPFPGSITGAGSMVAGGFGDGVKVRKGSIRNAVRKIFGRRSRDVASQGPNTFASASARHGYHKSEPTATLPAPQELPELAIYPEQETVHPSFADPYPPLSPSFNRTASPYAVQFPNSVKLKPMDLGNPFMTRPPQTQLKRRKTLSSLVVEERKAAAIAARAAARESSETQREEERFCETFTKPPTRNTSKIKKNRRQSRSADDLEKVMARDRSPPRKRSEEIRYWRESFQPDVLRASGFASRRPPEDETVVEQMVPRAQSSLEQEEADPHEESKQPALTNMDNFSLPSRSGTFRSSPPVRHTRGKSGSASLGESDMLQSSAVGTELSKDLEDRVAKLETGLQNFQRSLQRLTADRNRRTVIMGTITTRRSSSDMRTPSLLADTLADPLDPASYEYSYEQTALRPSTTPQQSHPELQAQSQPPPQMIRRSQAPMEDPFAPEPAGPAAPPLNLAVPAERAVESTKMPSPLSSHPPAQQPPVPGTFSMGIRNQAPPPYTFSSLYQMLADERSARRKLESQLKGLQHEISELHNQVSLSSNVQSARSSYMLAGSSTRLQELLRETEDGSSPPGTASRSTHRDSGMSSADGADGPAAPRRLDPIVSRFSVSESETGTGTGPGGPDSYEDLAATPYEAYRTPREARSAYSLASKLDDGEMF